MNDYRDITVIDYSEGRWEEGVRWVPGTPTERTVCGASAPNNFTRNRRQEGSNNTDTQTFYMFTDTWTATTRIRDNGREYTTQDFRVWPRFVEASMMVEKP